MKNYIYLLGVKIKMNWFDLFNIYKASLVLLINKEGKILCVSRKDNPNDFGLCGGKVDKGETFKKAAIRELFEETGLIGFNLIPIFFRKDSEFKCVTFLSSFKGEINVSNKHETGIVDWKEFSDIEKGSFGEYNKELKAIMIKIGLKFQS